MTAATPSKTMNQDSTHSDTGPEDAKKPDSRTPVPDATPTKKDDLLKGAKPSPGGAGDREKVGAKGKPAPEKKTDRPAPESPKPESAEPESPKSESPKPESSKPESSKPELSKPDAKARLLQTSRLWDEKGKKKEEAKKEQGKNEPDVDAPKGIARKPIEPEAAHVLVVEDNVPNFVLIARLLAYTGVERCEWKTSGWQVVEFADTLSRIDLILMDIRLPYEDGFQALKKVRAHPRFKDTLVVAVTAEASVEQMRRAKEAGFDGFLGKPLDPDKFPDQIRRVLSGQPVWEIH
jgi:two-component system cell cycle response regulator DivK